MTTLLTLQDVCVVFDDRHVIDNVSLSIESNKIITLIGPNGAGKSTLVKTILGLQKPTSGTIKKEKKLRIGYVPQKLHLNDSLPLSVHGFLKLAGKYSQQEHLSALKLVEAEHLLNSNMHKLSGGESQRVLLARALLQRPDLLVLDEPAQGVDVQGQISLYALIESIRHRFNCAVFMVSHDLHLVMAKTDEVICLQHHICCSGAPESISKHPKYIALFGQQRDQQLAFYHHEHHHNHDLSGEPSDGSCCSKNKKAHQ
ncbi:zinc ABC transporter ATP-binding protein ZnuC [Aliivibrio fischeri]|uniref:Zinc import ATP-binding protein ZnuC 1 n=4 Tax=Aliivibrio fischeri TaxID=668 RepID=ZNUC1_ALIF1|nr:MULTISPECIES: zinc ABC transporter ATP-binding protein ZnuC [Aliivibrio]Q5E6M2.1 RecName: Full=Zinc import ATP-binding protein ZnuC 1 [Aliivibrio fischeri ES114]AAW85324.1 zinc transporter subunit: ATP-binding component of ABC superfamily [Aliivibrio fischeri ES114]EHN71066.1 zinc ABC transporter ATP-binding protein [Aliivibrio fischeri SR5]KLU78416.1 zinc ABC transporter ATPase [Aliivibrio fischeri]MBD1568210.1 zinc ABC transporter ATP-binding protein ZnuC [Aliivibrio sp. S10_S31]MBP31413